MHIAEGSGSGMTKVLIDNVNKNDDIKVLLSSPAVENGQVIGAFVKKTTKIQY